jgi:hypothetical protein
MARIAEINIQQIMEDIKGICSSAPSSAEILVESYLENQLGSLTMKERIACVEKLISSDQPASKDTQAEEFLTGDALAHLISLLLGRNVSAKDLTSQEVTNRLVESFGLIFNNLNRLIESINTKLYGDAKGDQTIRQLIGSQIEGSAQRDSLECYINKIEQAFLTSHKAFSTAAKSIVSQVLEELDPEKMMSEETGGLKIGLFKKADCFDQFNLKYQVVKKWLESDRFVDKLLREFEKSCRGFSETQEESS